MKALEARKKFIDLEQQMLDHYGVHAVDRFVDIDNPRMRVHILEAGEGEPVLIFHGGDGEAVDWAPLIGKLQDHFHIFAVDRPGFGLSDPFDYSHVDLRTHAADFINSLLDGLGLESATLIGGSMGGFFILAMALAHSERVRRVILVGAAVGMTKEVTWPFRLVCGIPGASRWFMRSVASLKGQRNQYRGMFRLDPDSLPLLYFQTRVAALNMPGTQQTWALLLRRVGGLLGFRREMYLGDELHRLTMPTLILWGERDMVPSDLAQAAARRIPESTFVCMKGVAHFPFLEATEECARLILEFVGRSGKVMSRSGDGGKNSVPASK